MNKKTTRREVIKSIGLGTGSLLLTPILQQLAAHAAGEVNVPRKRFVFVVQSNGMNPNHLVPVGVKRRSDGKSERPQNELLEELSLRELELPTPIEALTPFKNRIALVQGLSGRIAEGGTGGHSTNHGCLGCYPGSKGPMAATIDVALGEVSPGIMPHLGLGIMNRLDQTFNYQISAAGPGKAAPIQCSPELAYKGLFGSVAGGTSRQAFDRRTNLLDFMVEDVRRSRNALAGEERAKLDSYLEAFESLHQRQGRVDKIQETLATHAPKLNDKFEKPTETNRLEAQFEIAAAALITGLTNVVTIASGGGGQHYISFPELGIPVDGHHYGHGGGVEGKTYEDCFVAVRQYHTKLIANLASKLESIPEGDGTMLDHTLIVYLSDSGDGHHPSLHEWPVILLGNLGGKLKTNGRYLQFPSYATKNHRTTASLYCTLLHAAGKPRDKFGLSDPGLRDIDQTGVISELLT